MRAHICNQGDFSTFSPKIEKYARSLLAQGRKDGELPPIDAQKLDERPAILRLFSRAKKKEENRQKAESLKENLSEMLAIEKCLAESGISIDPDINDKERAKTISGLKRIRDDNRSVEEKIVGVLECARYLASRDIYMNRVRTKLNSNLAENYQAMQNVNKKDGSKRSMFDKLTERVEAQKDGKEIPVLETVETCDVNGQGSKPRQEYEENKLRKEEGAKNYATALKKLQKSR